MDAAVRSLSSRQIIDYVKNAMGEGFTITPESSSGCC